MQDLELWLNLALLIPIFFPLLCVSIYVNYRTLALLRRQREVNLPPVIRRGSKKLFIVGKTNGPHN